MQMYFIRFYQSVLVTDTAWKFLKEGHFRHPSLVLWWCWRLLLDPAQCGVWLGWLQFLGMQQHKKNFTFSPLLYSSSAILILLNNGCTKLNSFRSIVYYFCKKELHHHAWDLNFFFGIFSFLILYQVITTFVGHLKSMPINFFRKLENTVLKSVQKPLMDI